MQTAIRNAYFTEKAHLIEEVMRRHYRMIRACRMEEEDVYQSLSLRMLEDLDAYLVDRNPNLDAYLRQRLGYEMFHLALPSRRYGIPGAPKMARLEILSLDAPERSTAVTRLAHQLDPAFSFWLKNEIASLQDGERAALKGFLWGKKFRCTNKALQSARAQILGSGDGFPCGGAKQKKEGQNAQNAVSAGDPYPHFPPDL